MHQKIAIIILAIRDNDGQNWNQINLMTPNRALKSGRAYMLRTTSTMYMIHNDYSLRCFYENTVRSLQANSDTLERLYF